MTTKTSHHCCFCSPHHWLWGCTEPPAEGQAEVCALVSRTGYSREKALRVLNRQAELSKLWLEYTHIL